MNNAMPFLILNMGGEMLYILEQRLSAQSIATDKSQRVLQDVINSMLRTDLLNELFKAQPIYSARAVREIFNKLAHSSIMRLNESSMDKLYDLMCMGVKYTLQMIQHPIDLLSITMNHFDQMKRVATANAHCERHVQNATQMVLQLFNQLAHTDGIQQNSANTMIASYELYLLRRALLSFFLDKQVKVSLFLQDGLQASDGQFLCTNQGQLTRACHDSDEVFGSVSVWRVGERVANVEILQLPNSKSVVSAAASKQPYNVHAIMNGARICTYGQNLYSKERRKSSSSQKSGSVSTIQRNGLDFAAKDDSTRSATSELNTLAALIGRSCSVEEAFQLNLFAVDENDDTDSIGSTTVKTYDYITFEASSSDSLKDREQLQQELDKTSHGAEEKGQNLLDLMDSAG